MTINKFIKILIINKMKNLSIVTELNDLYKLIINKFIEGGSHNEK